MNWLQGGENNFVEKYHCSFVQAPFLLNFQRVEQGFLDLFAAVPAQDATCSDGRSTDAAAGADDADTAFVTIGEYHLPQSVYALAVEKSGRAVAAQAGAGGRFRGGLEEACRGESMSAFPGASAMHGESRLCVDVGFCATEAKEVE